jgi:hypothetical protein
MAVNTNQALGDDIQSFNDQVSTQFDANVNNEVESYNASNEMNYEAGQAISNSTVPSMASIVSSLPAIQLNMGSMGGGTTAPIALQDASNAQGLNNTQRANSASAFVAGFAGQMAGLEQQTNADGLALQAAIQNVNSTSGFASRNATLLDSQATTSAFIDQLRGSVGGDLAANALTLVTNAGTSLLQTGNAIYSLATDSSFAQQVGQGVQYAVMNPGAVYGASVDRASQFFDESPSQQATDIGQAGMNFLTGLGVGEAANIGAGALRSVGSYALDAFGAGPMLGSPQAQVGAISFFSAPTKSYNLGGVQFSADGGISGVAGDASISNNLLTLDNFTVASSGTNDLLGPAKDLLDYAESLGATDIQFTGTIVDPTLASKYGTTVFDMTVPATRRGLIDALTQMKN